MRHVWTLIAAVVVAPMAWLLLAFGQDRSAQAFRDAQVTGAFDTGAFVRPVLCLVAAGLLLGILGTLRFSPLGAVVTGVVYAASYLALLARPAAVAGALLGTVSVAGRRADLAAPLHSGSALVLGTLLLVAVASIGRWRRWPAGDSAGNAPADRPPSLRQPPDRPLGADGLGLGPAGPAHDPADDVAWAPLASRDKPGRAEADRPSPGRDEPGWAEPGRGEPDWVGPGPDGPQWAEPAASSGPQRRNTPHDDVSPLSRTDRQPHHRYDWHRPHNSARWPERGSVGER